MVLSPVDSACFCYFPNSFQTIVLTVYNSEFIIVIIKMFTSMIFNTIQDTLPMLEQEPGRCVFACLIVVVCLFFLIKEVLPFSISQPWLKYC